MTARTIALLCGVLPAALLVGAPAVASPATGHAAVARTVVLKDISFRPSKLSVRRSQAVTFSWRDGDTPHNVTSRGSRKFKSSPTKSAGTYRVRLRRAGTYRYVCTIHPGMSGRINVK